MLPALGTVRSARCLSGRQRSPRVGRPQFAQGDIRGEPVAVDYGAISTRLVRPRYYLVGRTDGRSALGTRDRKQEKVQLLRGTRPCSVWFPQISSKSEGVETGNSAAPGSEHEDKQMQASVSGPENLALPPLTDTRPLKHRMAAVFALLSYSVWRHCK